MMNKLYISGLAMLLLVMAGCASVTKDIVIETEASPLAKFDSYKTYAWLGEMSLLRDPEEKWQPPKMNISGDIKYLVDRELRKKDVYNELTAPDLGVVFFVGVDMEAMKLKVDKETNADIIKNVPKAALVVALIDTKTEYVVWMGKATADVQNSKDVDVVRQRLDYAVREMFKSFK